MALLPGLAKAIAYAPIGKLTDLQSGDKVVIAIQNGRYNAAWYALINQTAGVQNATSITLRRNAISSNVTANMLWTVQVTGNVYSFSNISGGIVYELFAAPSGWTIQQITNTNRFIVTMANTTDVSIIWRTDSLGSRFSTYDATADTTFTRFDQVQLKRNLSSGAYAINFFKPSAQATFDGNNIGTPVSEVEYADKDGNITLPNCSSFAHFGFVGWAANPTDTVANIGKAGDVVKITQDVTYYAVYRLRNVHSQCFDFTQLNDPDICTCKTGSHSTSSYAVDGGWSSSTSPVSNRHQVIRTQGKDSKVSQLSLIPPGATASIKLGNSSTGAEKERISYVCEVDTTDNAVLMIKWACVLEDPSHSDLEQPRFELRIKDEFDQLIDSACGAFNFSSKANREGWKNFSGGHWKDWTTMSLDLAPYHGRRITIEFTTYDCTQSGHFGYGYFSLSCLSRSLSVGACAQVGSTVALTAPDGFFYHWTRNADGQDFGTNRSIDVPVDGNGYTCRVSTNQDGSCFFDLEATPVPYYPMAQFDAHILRGYCADTLVLVNNSFVTSDGMNPVSDRALDDILWNFGRGANDTCGSYDPPTRIVYNTPGKYHVSLYTGMDGWLCTSDEASFDFIVEANQQYQHFYDTICLGDSFEFQGKMFTPARAGTHNYFDTIRKASCFEEIMVEEHLYVAPKYQFFDEDTICWDEQYDWHGRTLTDPGVYYDSLLSYAGCDSLYILTLHQKPQQANNIYIEDTICEGDVYYWNDQAYFEQGEYKQHFTNQYGCDSTVILDLVVRSRYDFKPDIVIEPSSHPKYWDDPYWDDTTHTQGTHPSYWDDPYWTQDTTFIGHHPGYWDDPYVSRDTIIPAHRPDYWDDPYVDKPHDKDSVCEGDVYIWHGKALTEEGIYSDTLKTTYGCDSIVYMYLVVKPSYHFYEEQILNQGQTYTWMGHLNDTVVGDPGYYYDSLTTIYGCDSVYTLYVIVNGPYETTYLDTICQGDSLAFTSHRGTMTVYYHMPGEYTDTLSAMDGTDSISHVRLFVNPKSFSMTDWVMCEGDSVYWGERYWHEAVQTTDTLLNSFGCDSVAHFKLTVFKKDTSWLVDTICSSEKLTWNGKIYTTTTQDTVRLTNRHGCDSVDILDLFVIQPVTYDSVAVTCDGDSIFFFGQWIKKTGDYQKILTSLVTHCDSIYTLHAVISAVADTSVVDSICQGDTWAGVYYPTVGVYSTIDTLTRLNNCDSIVHRQIVVSPTYEVTESGFICGGDSLLWHGKYLKEDSTYIDTVPTITGCDSVCSFVLTVKPLRDSLETDMLCYGSAYAWAGQSYTNLTQDTLLCDTIPYLTGGCDSIHIFRYLTILPVPDTVHDDLDLCKGDTIEWHGQKVFEEKTYYDTLYSQTSLHCDSIYYSATSYFYPDQLKDSSTSICQGDSLLFGGKYLREEGDYVDTLHYASVYGCDSIVTLHLSIRYPSDSVTIDSICQGETFYWYSYAYTIPKDTVIHLTNAVGCDSICSLHLVVHQSSDSITTDTICQGETFYWYSYAYTTSKDTTIHLTNAMGCDSVCSLHLVMLPIQQQQEEKTICVGNSVNWFGRILTQAGTYDTTLVYSQHPSCDSLQARLILSVGDFYKDSTTLSTCQGVPVAWKGKSYTDEGVYRIRISGIGEDCDSILTMRLIVKQPSDSVTNASICQGQTFYWYSYAYTTSKDTTIHLTNAVGCDSACTLHLSVHDAFLRDTFVAACDSFAWRGTTYYASGEQRWTTSSISGCDSVIVLHLSIGHSIAIQVSDSACQTDLPFYWNRHAFYTTESFTFDTLTTLGCDSSITMNFKVVECCPTMQAEIYVPDICADATSLPIQLDLVSGFITNYTVRFHNPILNKYPFRDTTVTIAPEVLTKTPIVIDVPAPVDPVDSSHYPRPDDTYSVSFILRDACGDSLVWHDSTFTVFYPSWITDQHWDDVIALINNRYNGGYTFSHVEWLRDGEPLRGEDDNMYIYLPHELWTNPEHQYQSYSYQARLTRDDDGKTFVTCPIIPHHIDNTNVLIDPYVDVNPTLVPKENPVVRVMTNTVGTYWIYDATGKLLKTANYEHCEHNVFDIELYPVQTMYILVFAPRDTKKPLTDKYRVVKVLVE